MLHISFILFFKDKTIKDSFITFLYKYVEAARQK